MALPTQISTRTKVGGHQPPFKSSAGNFYALDSNFTEISMYKATDPTSSWTKQDVAGEPGNGGSVLSAVQVGDVLHIAGFNTSNGYRYQTFNMATDQWVVSDQGIDNVSSANPTFPWISIAVRSDGDVIVVYAGATDQVMGGKKERVDMNIRTSGTWGGAVALDVGGDFHYGNPVCVKASGTDDIHIIFQQQFATDDPPVLWANANLRTVDPSDVLSTLVTNTGEDSRTVLLGMQNAVSWDDAGTERIRVVSGSGDLTVPATEGFVRRYKDDTNADITTDAVKIQFAAATSEVKVNGEVAVTTMAIDPADDSLHVLWSNADDSNDIYYSTSTDKGATWTAEAQELDAVDCTFISANIYVRGTDTVLAYVYFDGSNVKYNEKVLSSGGLDLSPTGIASTESIGTPTITTGSVDLSPTGIASAESFGSPVVAQPVESQDLTPTGIASTESIGTPVVTTGAVTLTATGISSAESFGVPVITTGSVDLATTSIATQESFGSPVLTTTVNLTATGIATAESIGSPVISVGGVTLTATGIASAESFGAATIATGAVNLSTTGIPSTESFGAATVTLGAINLSPTGIASAESFGSATITTGGVTLTATAIASAEAIGAPTVTVGGVTLTASGIASAESIGLPALTTGAVNLSPTGISSEEAFGTAVVSQGQVLQATGIGSAESIGSPVITAGSVNLSPTGIGSEESFGSPVVSTEALNLLATGIPSTESIGVPTITVGAFNLSATGIASQESFGSPTVTTLQNLIATGIGTQEALGIPTVIRVGDKVIKIDRANEKILATDSESVTIYFNGTNYFTFEC